MPTKTKAARPALEGLGPPPSTHDLIKEAAELSAQAAQLTQIHAALAQLTFSSPPDRHELIRLLEVLQKALGPLLDAHESASGDIEVIHQHPTTEAMGFLATALIDLNYGVAHAVLRPPIGLGGALRPRSEHIFAHNAVAFVAALSATKGITRRAACKAVAASLSKSGHCWRGKPLTQKLLEAWCAGRIPGAKR